MAERLHLDAQNPWPGLAAFGEDDRDYFRGREREADELARLVRRERLTVLFGRSGLGKSSLLNAGLFPQLRDDLHLPVYLRIGYTARATPRQQVWDALAAACAAAGVQAPPPEPGESLWLYFHRAGAGFWNLRRRPLLPVLVFDQFEEIFTLRDDDGAARAAAAGFIDELADLVEDRPSVALRRELDADPSRGERIDFERRGCRVVLSFREDFLAEVEGLRTRMPSLMRNRFRLLPMSGEQARAVIAGGGALVGSEVAERIIGLAWRNRAEAPRPDEADRIEVDPALLSVICSELNLRRRAAGAATIEAGLLAGAEREILADFYERSLAGLDPGVREFVEDELITAAGYRDSYAYDDALARPGVSSEALEKLVLGRLLRLDERFGARRLELTHDVLTRVVMNSRDRRKQARADAERQRVEQLRTRRVRRLVASGVAASVTAFGVAIVFWVLLQRANAERQQLARTQSDVLLARANNLFELGVAGEPQISLARAIELNPESPSAIGRALAYLSQRSFPQRLAEHDLALDEFEALDDFEWRDGATLELRTAETRRAVVVPAAAALSGGVSGAVTRPAPVRLSAGDKRQQGPAEALPISAGPGLVAWLESPGRLVSAAPDARGPTWGVPVDKPLPPVVLSADGRRALLRVEGGRLQVYAVAADRAPQLLHTIAAAHGSARFGSGVVARDGAVVTVYSLDADRLHQLLHPMPVNALELSPDGRQIATACQDQHARLWDMATGRLIGAPMRHEGSVLSVAFSPDGRRLLSGALDGTARLWSASDAEAAGEPLLAGTDVRMARFSPDGRRAAVLAANGRLTFWRLDEAAPARSEAALAAEVSASALHAGGELLAVAGSDGSLGLWQLQRTEGAAARLRPLWSRKLDSVVRGLAFDEAGRRLAVATSDHAVRLVDSTSGAVIGLPMPHRSPVRLLRFSADGSLLATGADDGGARLFDTQTQLLHGFPMMHGNEALTRLELSPDRRLLLSVSSRQGGDRARLWQLATREAQVLVEAGHIAYAGFRNDGEIVTAHDKTVLRWTVAADGGRSAAPVPTPAAPALTLGHLIWSAALSSRRDLLAVGGLNGVTRSIDLAAGMAVGEPMKSVGVVEEVAFSGDGRWLLTRTAGLGGRLWDSRSGYGVADALGARGELSAVYLDGRAATAVLVHKGGTIETRALGLDFPLPAPRWLPALVALAGGGRQDASGAMTWTSDRDAQLAGLAADPDLPAPWWQQRRQEILARMGVGRAADPGAAK